MYIPAATAINKTVGINPSLNSGGIHVIQVFDLKK